MTKLVDTKKGITKLTDDKLLELLRERGGVAKFKQNSHLGTISIDVDGAEVARDIATENPFIQDTTVFYENGYAVVGCVCPAKTYNEYGEMVFEETYKESYFFNISMRKAICDMCLSKW